MMIQVTAYAHLDGWHVLATEMNATETGRRWTVLLQAMVYPTPEEEAPWDVVWRIGQELCEQALRAGGRQ